MVNPLRINIAKQETSSTNLNSNSNDALSLNSRHNEIHSICNHLSVSDANFNAEFIYEEIGRYISTYKRWLYSDISDFLFNCGEKNAASFISNLDILQEYARKRMLDCNDNEKEFESSEKMVTVIEKLWDHSNLAQKQNVNLHDSDSTFKARFNENLIPFKSDFTREMNMQFISLIAIFTALSFIVFGGISSLDNVFLGVKNIPILNLMIIGCIWGICISNLIFVFIFFVSKLTHISIKSSEKETSSICEKYPFIVWVNFIHLLIFSISCWLYYIDYSNSGGWLLTFSRNNPVCSSIGGIVLIIIAFVMGAVLILHHPKDKNNG